VAVERVADGYILFEVGLEITWSLWVMHLKKLVVWTRYALSQLCTLELRKCEQAIGERTERMKMIKKNESESYDVATYIGVFSFLWDVPCWLGFWLVGSLLGIHLLISQTLIGKIVMKSAPLIVQDLVLLFSIGKVGWKLFTLSIFVS